MRIPRSRRSRRAMLAALAAVPLSTLVAMVVGAGSALAQDTPNGQNGSTAPISTVAIVLIFVGVPLTVMILGALVTVPRRAVGALRYRPGRAWGYDREWFGQVPPGAGGQLAATANAQTVTVPAITSASAASVQSSGGASADW